MAKRPRGSYLKRLRARIVERDGPNCCYCGRITVEYGVPLCRKDDCQTLEHVRPLSLGGSNYADNLRIACFQCNFSRGANGIHPDAVPPAINLSTDGGRHG